MFKQISTSIIPLACKFLLASTNLGTPDPTKTNVNVDLGDGSGPTTILKDDTAPCDAGADGWQFSDNNQSVTLCGSICDKVKNSPNAKVSIELGCDTQTRVK